MGFGRSANYALWSPSALTVHRTVIHYLLCSNPKDSYIQGIPLRYLISHGGDDGIRTHDPLLAGQVLSQLSYTPILNSKFKIRNSKLLGFAISPCAFALVGPSGLEPPTSCLSGTRSNLLSYEPMWLVSVSLTLGFSVESRSLCSLTVLALSYFPGPLPAKYFRHCRA